MRMRPSAFSPCGGAGSTGPRMLSCEELLALALLAALAVLLGACIERNPYFDPDGGPLCAAGERQCSTGGLDIEICTEDATGFTVSRTCFASTHCQSGACVPDAPATPCARAGDCQATGQVCSVAVDPEQPAQLATYCVPPPYPAGRPGGQACASHAECRSGWCFRQVCFEACQDASECTNPQHTCVRFDVTVDGVRDSVHVRGCGPPG